jgi:uncharacterized membrane protein YukC
MNQKTVIAILGIAVVALICTTVYFATLNKASQNKVISSNNEFQGVGFDGDKCVFMKTGEDDSQGGPCSDRWLYNNLSYININATELIRQPYTISAEKRQQVQKEIDNCIKQSEPQS